MGGCSSKPTGRLFKVATQSAPLNQTKNHGSTSIIEFTDKTEAIESGSFSNLQDQDYEYPVVTISPIGNKYSIGNIIKNDNDTPSTLHNDKCDKSSCSYEVYEIDDDKYENYLQWQQRRQQNQIESYLDTLPNISVCSDYIFESTGSASSYDEYTIEDDDDKESHQSSSPTNKNGITSVGTSSSSMEFDFGGCDLLSPVAQTVIHDVITEEENEDEDENDESQQTDALVPKKLLHYVTDDDEKEGDEKSISDDKTETQSDIKQGQQHDRSIGLAQTLEIVTNPKDPKNDVSSVSNSSLHYISDEEKKDENDIDGGGDGYDLYEEQQPDTPAVATATELNPATSCSGRTNPVALVSPAGMVIHISPIDSKEHRPRDKKKAKKTKRTKKKKQEGQVNKRQRKTKKSDPEMKPTKNSCPIHCRSCETAVETSRHDEHKQKKKTTKSVEDRQKKDGKQKNNDRQRDDRSRETEQRHHKRRKKYRRKKKRKKNERKRAEDEGQNPGSIERDTGNDEYDVGSHSDGMPVLADSANPQNTPDASRDLQSCRGLDLQQKPSNTDLLDENKSKERSYASSMEQVEADIRKSLRICRDKFQDRRQKVLAESFSFGHSSVVEP